jgi:hypothetical protein
MLQVPGRWRFTFDDDERRLHDLAWPEAVQTFHNAKEGELAAESDGECVSLEFNTANAAMLYLTRDGRTLRPYFPRQPASAQDLEPFFDDCGLRTGDQAAYLARFLLSRADGFGLFTAVLAGPPLPSALPDPQPDQPWLPGFEGEAAEWTGQRILEWRPLPKWGV